MSAASTCQSLTGDAMDILPTLPRGSFDLLLSDPPYAMPATFYEGRGTYRRWSDSSILAGWWRMVFERVRPCMKPDGMVAVFANASAVTAFWPTLYEHTTNLQLAVWDKCSFGMGRPLRNQCEFIIVGSLGKSFASDLGVSNVFRIPRVSKEARIHPAQKPVALMQALARQLCVPGGAVLDPFAGSRCVEAACQSLGMRCTSIDWDEPPPGLQGELVA